LVPVINQASIVKKADLILCVFIGGTLAGLLVLYIAFEFAKSEIPQVTSQSSIISNLLSFAGLFKQPQPNPQA